jgi:hypothetical protein
LALAVNEVENYMLNRIEFFLGRLLGIEKYFPERHVEFVWVPRYINVEILSDNVYKKIGKHLKITRGEHEGDERAGMSIFNIPNTWQINSAKIEGENIVVKTSEHGVYIINKQNYGDMNFDILNGGGDKNDSTLEAIWRKHAYANDYS